MGKKKGKRGTTGSVLKVGVSGNFWEVMNASGAEALRLYSTGGSVGQIKGKETGLDLWAGEGQPSTPLEVNGWDKNNIGISTPGAIQAGKKLTDSDARAKRDVEEVNGEQALANVLKLKAREYGYVPQYAIGAGRRDRGFIAQELARVLPHAVHKTRDHELSNGKKLKNFRAIDYNNIVVELVAAFQALHKEHKEVVARLDRLEASERRRAPRKRS